MENPYRKKIPDKERNYQVWDTAHHIGFISGQISAYRDVAQSMGYYEEPYIIKKNVNGYLKELREALKLTKTYMEHNRKLEEEINGRH